MVHGNPERSFEGIHPEEVEQRVSEAGRRTYPLQPLRVNAFMIWTVPCFRNDSEIHETESMLPAIAATGILIRLAFQTGIRASGWIVGSGHKTRGIH